MTTQREPDTSANRWVFTAESISKHYSKPGESESLFTVVNSAMQVAENYGRERALADAAGQAAPVPPPVEGQETTKAERDDWQRHADGAAMWSLSGTAAGRLLRDLARWHDRAEGLAKEVERLKEDCAFLHRRRGQLCIQRDEEVAKHKATHAAYREAEADAEQWRERAFAAEAKLAVYEAPIGDGDQTTAEERAWFVRRADDAGRMCRDYLRLSAAHAECKGENTKLREAVSRARRELEHGWPVSAASTLDAALAPASGEATNG